MRFACWAATLLLAVAILSGCGNSTDHPARTNAKSTTTTNTKPDTSEAAWRAALELEEIPDKVWKRYRDHVYDVCDDSEDTFELFVAMMLDDNDRASIGRFRESMPYACPDRVEQFDKVVASTENPCAELTQADRRAYEQAMRAMGERGWTCP